MALTKSAIYKTVYDYLFYDVENLDKMIDTWKDSRETKLGTGSLISLLSKLKSDIREENNKGNGKANIAKGMNAVIKNSIKFHPWNKQLNGYFMSGEQQCVSDGFRVIRLKEGIKVELQAADDQGAGNKVWDWMRGVLSYEKKLSLPTIGELKTQIKITKDARYVFGDDLPEVNAQYLLDFLTVFPDAEVYWDGNVLAPIYIKGEQGDGILLPIKKR